MASFRQQGVSPLHRMRHPDRHSAWIWVMTMLMLAQALFPIQSHTRWALADDGQVIEICTLHGSVSVDPSSGEPTQQDDDRTAAMSFSMLMAEALSGHFEVQPAWLALLSTPVAPAVIGKAAQSAPRHAPIRAPPSLV